jgi:hypothetical protein
LKSVDGTALLGAGVESLTNVAASVDGWVEALTVESASNNEWIGQIWVFGVKAA